MTAGLRALLLVLAALALPALALVAKLPSQPQLLGILNDAAHAPVFGLQAIVLWSLLGRFATLADWQRRATAFAIAVAAGGLVEIVQPFFGRGAEWTDLGRDALGAAAGLALHAALCSAPRPGPRLRAIWLTLAALAIAIVAWPVGTATIAYVSRASQFPVLLGDGSAADRHFLRVKGVETTRTGLPTAWRVEGEPASLQVRIVGHRWPGLTLSEPQPDWRGFHTLKLDLTNPDSAPLPLTLRVHDRAHDNRQSDRFNLGIELPPRARTQWSVPLKDVAAGPAGRRLDLARVAGVILFADGDAGLQGRQYYVTRIWLE